MIIRFLLIFLSVSAYGRDFTIPAGNHRSLPILTIPFVGTQMYISAIFDESAKYEFPVEKSSDQGDVNKLYGFSDCGGSHMQNSARFGWNWYNNKLSVYAFTHVAGKLNFQFLSDVDFNKPYHGSIQIHPDKKSYIFNFNGNTVLMERGCQELRAWGYHLFPYFGGQQVAPHEIKLNIKVNENQVPVIADLPYPNPTTNGQFKMKVTSEESLPFLIKIHDLAGRLLYKSTPSYLNKNTTDIIRFDLGKKFSNGMYIVTPMIISQDGHELPTNVTTKGHDSSYKLIILNR